MGLKIKPAKYKIIRVFRHSKNVEILERNLTKEIAQKRLIGYPIKYDSKVMIVTQ